jgi:hypothetical protein
VSEVVPQTLPVPTADATAGLLPARMLNEFAYCPRLWYIEWVQGECADGEDTFYRSWAE